MKKLSEMSYAWHVAAADDMSTDELNEYVQQVLGIAPPDDRSGWHVRVEWADTPTGQFERFTWQRTECHVIEPWE